MGVIPWSKIVKYGHHVGLDDDMISVLVTVIRAMDAKYVEWQEKENDKKSDKRGPQPGNRKNR